jgi:hypothetical protein
MLLDEIMPEYDFTEIHSKSVKSSLEQAYEAIMKVSLTDISGIVNLLLSLRNLPEKLVGREVPDLKKNESLLDSMKATGSVILTEDAPHEFVFGMIVSGSTGRFWKKSTEDIPLKNAEEYFNFNNPDYVLFAANFLVKEGERPGFVLVSTESRTKVLSPPALKNFTPYWRIIRPFSGLIRRLFLRGVRRLAEQETAKSSTGQSLEHIVK